MSQLAHTRPRSVTEIIDASFRFYRARFGDLMVLSALLLVPPVLLAALAPTWLGLPLVLLFMCAYLAGQGAIAVLVAASIERDETLWAGTVFRRLGGRRAVTVILVSIAAALLAGLGFLFFIIPGFIAIAWLAASVPVAAIEGLSVGGAIRRSRDLARGRIWHIYGTLLLVWLILFVLAMGVVFAFVMFVAALNLPLPVISLLGQLVQLPVFPLVSVVSTMLYYDLRVRTDGADVAAMIEALPVTPIVPAEPA